VATPNFGRCRFDQEVQKASRNAGTCGHRSSCHCSRSALPILADYSTGMWETPLDKVIRLEDGRTIKTLADARDVILGLPEQEQQRPQWQAEMIYQAPTQRECPRPVVNLAYDLCRRRGQYLKVALIARFGGDVLVSH
jgi:hypothetical protein